MVLKLEPSLESPRVLVDYRTCPQKFLIHRSAEERGLRICMSNMQSKFSGDADAAIGDHTQRSFDVAVVTIQVFLTAKPWARNCRGTVGLSLLWFITTI